MNGWPASAAELVAEQTGLAGLAAPLWDRSPAAVVGGCFVCFERGPSGPGRAGDRAWAAAAAGGETATITGTAGAGYEAGLLALREGVLLEAAVRALPRLPDVLLVDATGRDHPRRAGLALQLGAVLDVPTVGVTHRTLLAAGDWPADEPGATSPFTLADEVVGFWLRTVRGRRPLAVHAAWRTDPNTAVDVVLSCTSGVRTPEPLRRARTAARRARAAEGSGTAADPAAREFLRKADPVLARLIDARPRFRPRAWLEELPPLDAFGALLFQVAGQQLSVRATRAIISRLQERFGGRLPSPAEVLESDPQTLRGVGLSARKAETLRALAERFVDGRLSGRRLSQLTDAEIEATLTEVPGIGPWTVHGFLIVALDRPDVVLPGDLALRRAVKRAYALDHLPTGDEMMRLAERWRPYRSLAVSYLFASEHET